MSEMERNKGRMIRSGLTLEQYKNIQFPNFPNEEVDFEDWMIDNDLVVIKGVVYKIEYDVRRDTEMNFQEVEENNYGDIYFHTIHYNGGGSLEEVVESALKENLKEKE